MKQILKDQKQVLLKIIFNALFALIMLVLICGCSDSKSEKRNVESVQVVTKEAITSVDDGEFYYPRYSNNGSKIFLTSANNRGIWYYDLTRRAVFQLNSFLGAGQEFTFSVKDTKIYFKIDSIGTDRRKRSYLCEQDINSLEIKNLIGEPIRSLSHIKLIDDQYLTFLDGDRLRVLDRFSSEEKAASIINDPILVNYQNKILSFVHGEKKVYDPFKGENLIWGQSIPSRDEYMVYVVGQGLNYMDNNGKVVGTYGDLRAARWSPDKDLIAYMQDTDDGIKITGSDVIVVTPDKRIKVNLTNTPDKIEMYPEWAPDGSEIVYHTIDGQIYRMQLDVK